MTIHFHTVSLDNEQARKHKPCVLAIGNMDGVHLGHQALITTAKALSMATGYRCAALTFTPHPREYFNPSLKPLTLMRPAAKIHTLRQLGVQNVIFSQFDHDMATMEPENFIDHFCIDTLGAHHLVTGNNFYFGRNRRGDVRLLEEHMRSHELGYSCVEPVHCETGEVISSTRIRQVLSGGNVAAAAKLLGRPYSIEGRVGHGEKRGREIGFPTANIPLYGLYLPAFGVYAIRAVIGDEKRAGVANLGIRPTFRGKAPLLEVHLFDWDGLIYGQRVQIELHHYLRPEQSFEKVQLLIDQLHQDVIEARSWFKTHQYEG